MISAGSGKGRNKGSAGIGRMGGMIHLSLQLQPVMWLVGHCDKEQIYSCRNTNSLAFLQQHVCISVTRSKSTVLHTEHGASNGAINPGNRRAVLLLTEGQ